MTLIPNLFDLTGRTALITGGSRGLGLAMAKGFIAAGADVVVSSRHEPDLLHAVAEIRTHGQGRVAHCVAEAARISDLTTSPGRSPWLSAIRCSATASSPSSVNCTIR